MFERAPIVFLLIVTITLQQLASTSAATIHHASVNVAEDSPNAVLGEKSTQQSSPQRQKRNIIHIQYVGSLPLLVYLLPQVRYFVSKFAGNDSDKYIDVKRKHTANLAKYAILMLTKPSKYADVEKIVDSLEGREWTSNRELREYLGSTLLDLDQVLGYKSVHLVWTDFTRSFLDSDESEDKRYLKGFLHNLAVIFKYQSLATIREDKLDEGVKLFKEPTYQWSSAKEFFAYAKLVGDEIEKLNGL